MTTFIAVYRGDTVAGARIVALSADPEIVRDLATRLLESAPECYEEPESVDSDKRRAMRVVKD